MQSHGDKMKLEPAAHLIEEGAASMVFAGSATRAIAPRRESFDAGEVRASPEPLEDFARALELEPRAVDVPQRGAGAS